ncbi:hypothetical protein AC1031_005264 [Aphanomyces cochlioides]|nr:hypothetical protein AC1031_005264 [Aphanomyces cochlioides]
MHRIVWSFIIVSSVVAAWRWQTFRSKALTLDHIQLHATSAVFIGANWVIFVWAVNSGYVIQASLGGYILLFSLVSASSENAFVPFNVVAVVVISIGDGVVPWISLALALTEGVYGLLKKQASLSSLDGVAIETGALFLPSVGYLVAAETHGQCAFGHVSIATSVLLIGAGIMATTTLLAFGYAVQHVPLTLIGVLRFLTPTIQVCLAVFVYHEQFSLIHSVGFVLLWTALVIFTTQSYTIQQEAKRRKKYDVEMDDVDVLWSHATQSLLDVQDDAKAMYQSI